jgi:2-dehydropantoate 2-reductase
MRFAILGAGAIGGLLGARLAAAGHDVALVARGPHLDALRTRGLTLAAGEGHRTFRLPATDEPAAVGPRDCVVLAVKAPAVPAAVAAMAPLLGPATTVVPVLNGIPWWYGHGMPGDPGPLDSVDPGGLAWQALDRGRILGCVTHAAASVPEPGVVRHAAGERFVLGEPDGSRSARLAGIAAAFRSAGLDAPETVEIRREIWLKAWGNAAFNPVSALTGATMAEMCEDEGTAGVLRAVMAEVEAVAAAQGIRMPVPLEERFGMARGLGRFRTSMLQDLEAGRPLELDAILGVVVELGRRAGVGTPLASAILALVRLRALAR